MTLNKVRVINLCYIEILLQILFIIRFLYTTLFWVKPNIHGWVDSIKSRLDLFDSIGNQLTADYKIFPSLK